MSNSNSTVRFCPKCQRETEHKARGGCKPCAKAYNAAYYSANTDKAKAYAAAWKAANLEKYNANQAAWKAVNQEKIKSSSAEYSAANREKIDACTTAWRAANPERYRDYAKTWRAAHPDDLRIYQQNRRAQKRKNGGSLSKGLSAKLFKLQKGKCACCGQTLGKNYHLDHIMPIALGGSNTDDNMQLLRQRCNNQKHAKHPVDFMQQRGFLL